MWQIKQYLRVCFDKKGFPVFVLHVVSGKNFSDILKPPCNSRHRPVLYDQNQGLPRQERDNVESEPSRFIS